MEIVAEETIRNHFTMIPNVVDDLGLSPQAFRLYCHLRRVAGEADGGVCYQSTATLAAACAMSAGAVSHAKGELVRAGLIRVEKRRGDQSDVITIVDIWARNAETFRPSVADSDSDTPPQENAERSQCERDRSQYERDPSKYERDRSQCETKKNTIKNNRIKKNGVNALAKQEHSHSAKAERGESAIALGADTPGARVLFAKLQRAANDLGRRGPSRFATRQQKSMFLEAEGILGADIARYVDAALARNILVLGKVVAYVAGAARRIRSEREALATHSARVRAAESAGKEEREATPVGGGDNEPRGLWQRIVESAGFAPQQAEYLLRCKVYGDGAGGIRVDATDYAGFILARTTPRLQATAARLGICMIIADGGDHGQA